MAQVTSFNGRTGAVVPTTGDYTCSQVTDCLTNSLTSGHIYVGNGSNVATDVAMSGDATLANTGAITVTKTNGTVFGSAATANTGTGGHVVGFLDGANTWTNIQTIAPGTPYGLIITSTASANNGSNLILVNDAVPSGSQSVDLRLFPSGGSNGESRLSAFRNGSNSEVGLAWTIPTIGEWLNVRSSGITLTGPLTLSATETISAATGAGGLRLNNSTRSTSWSLTPLNSNQDGTSTDLQIYSNTGNGYAGQVGFFSGFDGRLVVGRNAIGVPNARQYNSFQAMGPYAGENNGFEAMAVDGWQQVSLTRYDTSGGSLAPVGAYEQLGTYCFSAFSNPSTNCVSGLIAYTTETQVQGSNEGASVHMFYTPNGSTGLLPGVTLSAGGTGGVSIGATAGSFPSQVPTDLGNGTVHARSDIASQGHFRGTGSAPASSSCGGTVTFGTGATDNGGIVSTGSSCSTVVINFNAAYAQNPACIVQVYANASPTAYVSAISTTSFTVTLTSAMNGAFMYICMGAG